MATVNQGWRGQGQGELLELVPLGPAFVVDSVAVAARPGQPLTVEQCGEALRRVTRIKDAVRYWRGDLMNLAETLFAEEASQIVDHELLSEAEAAAEKRVAKNVLPTTRAHAPTWEHAHAVAHLTPEAQVEWLDKARAGSAGAGGTDEPWSARKMATEIARAGAEGKTVMRWWLVVETKTEVLRNKLADELSARGHGVKKQEKLAKVKRAKRKKKGPVTAQRKRKGAAPLNTRKRVPR